MCSFRWRKFATAAVDFKFFTKMRRSSAALSLALVVLVSVSVTWAVRVSEDPEDTNAVLDNKNAERAHEQPAQPPFHITPTPWVLSTGGN